MSPRSARGTTTTGERSRTSPAFTGREATTPRPLPAMEATWTGGSGKTRGLPMLTACSLLHGRGQPPKEENVTDSAIDRLVKLGGRPRAVLVGVQLAGVDEEE